MESPFDSPPNGSSSTMVALYLEPILHSLSKQYVNVLTVSAIPAGPIKEMVTHMNAPRLSPLHAFPPATFSPFGNCTYVLCRYPGGAGIRNGGNYANGYMFAEDIPNVYNYLLQNGYRIEERLTHMSFDSPVNMGARDRSIGGRRRLVCMFSYTSP
jgi:hypothetical protein